MEELNSIELHSALKYAYNSKCKLVLNNLHCGEICIARVTNVILVRYYNSASRKYTLAGRNVFRELICLTSSLLVSLNQDSKGYNTPDKSFILWLLCANCLLLISKGKSLTVVSVCLVDLKMNTEYLKFMIF